MSKSCVSWKEDPLAVFNGDDAYRIVPSPQMSDCEKENTLVRFITLIAIIWSIYSKSFKPLLIGALGLLVYAWLPHVYIFYSSSISTTTASPARCEEVPKGDTPTQNAVSRETSTHAEDTSSRTAQMNEPGAPHDSAPARIWMGKDPYAPQVQREQQKHLTMNEAAFQKLYNLPQKTREVPPRAMIWQDSSPLTTRPDPYHGSEVIGSNRSAIAKPDQDIVGFISQLQSPSVSRY